VVRERTWLLPVWLVVWLHLHPTMGWVSMHLRCIRCWLVLLCNIAAMKLACHSIIRLSDCCITESDKGLQAAAWAWVCVLCEACGAQLTCCQRAPNLLVADCLLVGL
jgi:hypothetical protein